MSSKRRPVALALCCYLSTASAFVPASTTASAPRRRPRTSVVAETQLHVSASYLFGTGDSPSASGSGAASIPTDGSTGQPYLPQVNHRHSARDWIHNVASLPHSSILRDIKAPVLAVMGWSTVVSVVHRLLLTSANPVWAGVGSKLQVGATAHSFLVSSLGLLLVFRTNSAYQRFAVSCLSLDRFDRFNSFIRYRSKRSQRHFFVFLAIGWLGPHGFKRFVQSLLTNLTTCMLFHYYQRYRRVDESGKGYCPRVAICRG